MKHTSVRLSDEQHRVVQALAETDHVDGQSEAVRTLLDAAIDESDDVDELVPDHVRILHDRERLVERNRVQQLRGGFRSRVVEQLRHRFSKGWTPEEIHRVIAGYHDEVDLLFRDDEDRRDDLHDWLDGLVRDYSEAWTDGDDPLENPFDGFEGVEDGRAERDALDRVDEALVEDARRLLAGTPQRGVPERSEEQVVERLSERVDVDEATARVAVQRAAEDGGER